jgi:chromosome partitioning protein
MNGIMAISNHKGGVAKTTTCLSLGAALAERGRRALVIDLDPQADLTLATGLNAEDLPWSVADLLDCQVQAPPAGETIQPTRIDGLEILPADARLASVERALYEVENYEERLMQILDPCRESYAAILIDCPPSLGALTLMALNTAQQVLIPVQCEYYAARRLEGLLEVVEAVKERTLRDLDCRLLPTLYDQRNRICQGVLAQLQENFAEQVTKTVIGVDTRLRECPAAGEPVILYAPRSRASEQYRQLARELFPD